MTTIKGKVTAIEGNHPGLMRQFELYAIVTPTYTTVSVAPYLMSGRLC